MSGLLRPVGPEGAQTYWARRGLVLGATAVLAIAASPQPTAPLPATPGLVAWLDRENQAWVEAARRLSPRLLRELLAVTVDASEQVVLPALVEVQAANHALPRERDVRLHGRLRQRALTPELHEPPSLVVEAAKRDPDEALDHAGRLTPLARTKSFTS
jgi:hypothetical protein